jgi:hypothetical protein
VTGTISLTDKFALASAPDREELGLILGIAPRKVPMLRARAGAELGQRMGVAANPPARGGIADEITPGSKNKQLLGDLQRAGFVSLGSGTGPEAVPAGAVFLVVAGDAGAPPFNATNLLIPFVRHLAGVGAVVTVASPSASSWKVVDEIRSESRTAAEVSTVDDAETIPGHISSVLTLDRSADDPADHYGTGPGATSVIPSPPPSQNR